MAFETGVRKQPYSEYAGESMVPRKEKRKCASALTLVSLTSALAPYLQSSPVRSDALRYRLRAVRVRKGPGTAGLQAAHGEGRTRIPASVSRPVSAH